MQIRTSDKKTEIKRGPRSLPRVWKLPGGPLFIFLCVFFALALAYGAASLSGFDPYSALGLSERLSCGFHAITGLYCPGCGGTRSVIRLLGFDPVRSFLLHPVPLLVFALAANFFVRFIFAYLVPEKCPVRLKPARFRPVYLILICVLLFLNFIVKNVLLLCGIDSIAFFQ